MVVLTTAGNRARLATDGILPDTPTTAYKI